MRILLLLLAAFLALGTAHAQSTSSAMLQDCFSARELQGVLETSGVINPATAVMTARRQVPNADVVRANLCRNEDALVYVIVALRKDGRIVHVMIDGPSGRVRSVQ